MIHEEIELDFLEDEQNIVGSLIEREEIGSRPTLIKLWLHPTYKPRTEAQLD
jgi:hypothetical protein